MNYQGLYTRIIEFRKNNATDGYSEKHHVIPRSIGGDDTPENLVRLTAREHFICHYLLTKIYDENSVEWHKMNHAFMMMAASSSNQQRYFNSRLYESARNTFSSVMSKSQTGELNSGFGTKWISNPSTNESKKIPKNSSVPENWIIGRNKKFTKCKICSVQFVGNTKCCSDGCRSKAKRIASTQQERKPLGFVTRKQEFMTLFETCETVSDCLRTMGYDPRCGRKRAIVKQWLLE